MNCGDCRESLQAARCKTGRARAFRSLVSFFISPTLRCTKNALSSTTSAGEERADRAADEWFESHSRPPPLKKHLQASARKRRVARRCDTAEEPEALAER